MDRDGHVNTCLHGHQLYLEDVEVDRDGDVSTCLHRHQLYSEDVEVDRDNNNNNLFYIAPQQQLYELLALYRSTNAIEHTSICYLN